MTIGANTIQGTINYGNDLKALASKFKLCDTPGNIVTRGLLDTVDIGMATYNTFNTIPSSFSADIAGLSRATGVCQTALGLLEMVGDNSDRGAMKGIGDMLTGLGLIASANVNAGVGFAVTALGVGMSTFATVCMEKK